MCILQNNHQRPPGSINAQQFQDQFIQVIRPQRAVHLARQIIFRKIHSKNIVK